VVENKKSRLIRRFFNRHLVDPPFNLR